MVEKFQIPGMMITRDDIRLIVYNNTMSKEEVANKLSDDDMVAIADIFSQLFFDGYDRAFSKLLISSVKCHEEIMEALHE
ncbi:MAG: hypothetical protein EHM34_06410 [Nitrosopumilales archaeon]|nr:MAG: hypothetical protein EHM34_06410 [Nitrosopumilales archaeon]